MDEHALGQRGLRDYWGYNSIAFFAPHGAYAADTSRGGPVREFKTMVKALHRAGLEVILDVVYNHTAEGSHLGPTLGFRGIDNTAYYRLVPGQPRYYQDFTGCGNTLDLRQPRALQLLMDSLHGAVINKAFRLEGLQREAFVRVEEDAMGPEIPEDNRIFLGEDAAQEARSGGFAVEPTGFARLKGFTGLHRVYRILEEAARPGPATAAHRDA